MQEELRAANEKAAEADARAHDMETKAKECKVGGRTHTMCMCYKAFNASRRIHYAAYKLCGLQTAALLHVYRPLLRLLSDVWLRWRNLPTRQRSSLHRYDQLLYCLHAAIAAAL